MIFEEKKSFTSSTTSEFISFITLLLFIISHIYFDHLCSYLPMNFLNPAQEQCHLQILRVQ